MGRPGGGLTHDGGGAGVEGSADLERRHSLANAFEASSVVQHAQVVNEKNLGLFQLEDGGLKNFGMKARAGAQPLASKGRVFVAAFLIPGADRHVYFCRK